MPKPTKNAALICTILSIISLVGIIIGLASKNALWITLLILPLVIYEVYRVEGKSTRSASWGILAIVILEIVFIIFNINFDLAAFLGESSRYVAGYNVPLGDIKIVGPIIIGILSVILLVRTRGIYTKWLAVAIIINVFSIVYILNPEIFSQLLKMAAKEGLDQVSY